MCTSPIPGRRSMGSCLLVLGFAIFSSLGVRANAGSEVGGEARVDLAVSIQHRKDYGDFALQVRLQAEEPIKLLYRQKRFDYLCLVGIARIETRTCDGTPLDSEPRGFLPLLEEHDFQVRRVFEFEPFGLVLRRDGEAVQVECLEARVIVDTSRAIEKNHYDTALIKARSRWVRVSAREPR